MNDCGWIPGIVALIILLVLWLYLWWSTLKRIREMSND